MEDRTIRELEDAGVEYAEIRDARIKLTAQEVDLKKRTKALMKKHKKKTYVSSAVDIELVPPGGEEDVKVKLKKPKPPKVTKLDAAQIEA